MRARLCDHNGKSQQNTHPNIYLVVLLLLHWNGGQCVKTVNIYSNSIYQDDSLVSNVTNNSIFGRVNSKHTRKKKQKWTTEYIPSTFPSASTHMVWKAGIAHASRWNKCDLFSIASCPHFSPAAKNHASAKHAHQANAAIQQKYNAINKIVHNVDWRCPCIFYFFDSENEDTENDIRLLKCV